MDKNQKKHKGEIGVANLITDASNYHWKRIKIGIFEKIKKNPDEFFKQKDSLSATEKLELNQYLFIEIISESVSYAELLGAYLLVFSKKDPVLQKTLLNYKVKDISNLFENLKKQDTEGIAKIIGYPSLSEFRPKLNKQKEEDFKQSLLNIKKELEKIAKFYIEYRQFYNDYKHGFRIFPFTTYPPDSKMSASLIQIKKGESLNQVIINHGENYLNKKEKEAIEVSNRITNILEILIPIFKNRFIENKKTFSLIFFGVSETKNTKNH